MRYRYGDSKKEFLMLIDFHTHCFPHKIAARAMESLSNESALVPPLNGTLEELQRGMDEGNVKLSVVLGIATNPHQQAAVNNYAAELNNNPNLVAFGSVHPFSDDYKYYVDFLCDNGIKGMKFQPFYQDFYVNDKQALKVYEYIASKGMVLFFHSGVDLLVKGDFCSPKKVREVLDSLKYPKTVLAHMGGWGYGEEYFELVVGSDCYLDVSFSYRYEDENTRAKFMQKHSTDKILFATDRPWTDAKTDIDLVKQLPNDLSEKILYKNAKKLLGI